MAKKKNKFLLSPDSLIVLTLILILLLQPLIKKLLSEQSSKSSVSSAKTVLKPATTQMTVTGSSQTPLKPGETQIITGHVLKTGTEIFSVK
jgi:hypothetical protein